MVQTLTTMFMTHIQRPSLRHCLIVSKALHANFKFLGDDISEVILYIVILIFLNLPLRNSWKWFIYNRAQNVNRDNSEAEPVKKKLRTEESTHPIVAVSANNEESNKRNTDLLRNESSKTKPRYDVMKELIVRTYPS